VHHGPQEKLWQVKDNRLGKAFDWQLCSQLGVVPRLSTELGPLNFF
jgi:hypothetical protein